MKFVNIEYATEREHLKEPSEKDVSQEIEDIKQLSGQGKSIRDIAKELNISKSKVGRILKSNVVPLSHCLTCGTMGQRDTPKTKKYERL